MCRLLDRFLEHTRGDIVPVTLINLPRGGKRQLIEQLARAPVQNKLQKKRITGAEQLHARRLVNATRFDADETVFDQMQADADAVPAADAVRGRQRRQRIGAFTIQAHRLSFFKTYGDFFGLVGRLFRPHAHFGHDEMRRRRKQFELAGFVRETQQIGVGRVGLLARRFDRQAVLFAILDHLQASAETIEKSLVAPRRVNAEGRLQHIGDELKPDLIVAASGRAVRKNRDAAFFNFRQQSGA